mgnify:CR=1 FL=1
MRKNQIKIIKTEKLDEVLNFRSMLASCLPSLKKKTTKKYLKNRIRGKEEGMIKAVLGKKVLGFLTWLKESKAVAYIRWLVVDKKYQRNQVGSRLMEEAIKELTKRGFKKVWAKIKNDNFRALALAVKFHFVIEGIWKEDRFFTVIVAKNLVKSESMTHQ